MRELEFLPTWYPQARRRKRMVVFQFWTTLLLTCGLGIWSALAHSNVSDAERALGALDQQLRQTRTDLERLDEQLKLKQELKVRERINADLGTEVETTRLLATIERIMPREMSLIELVIETEELTRPVTGLAGAAKSAKDAKPPTDRRLKVRLQGVAPTDLDMVTFLTGLTEIRCFENVVPSWARDRAEAGHIMREFEVTFFINLSEPMGR